MDDDKIEYKDITIEEIIRKFINDNDLTCDEDVYLTRSVTENSYDFIVELCNIVGYKETEEK